MQECAIGWALALALPPTLLKQMPTTGAKLSLPNLPAPTFFTPGPTYLPTLWGTGPPVSEDTSPVAYPDFAEVLTLVQKLYFLHSIDGTVCTAPTQPC